ncbi:hypothetical protein ADT67_02000 [Levilactobacillus brevis]|uniref:Putative membrane protein n=1 Tax=Levilactobacillus brevis TaxID=1580 RepID=A0A5B7Y2X8_LEVBR|nr:YoaK family protein [Levilactobacillus brevis]AJA81358.1 hypothetical protein L747_12495 [Levilactobacillus brevis BSO 464]KIO94004.1 putative Membrane protein [Levilactobacillus brevis]KIO99903.1 putative Membrane protein [Levilactobacillus brevis]OLF68334.1 hypothetical protein ADT67_02000 [Levilactobacillus brevis]QCZ49352.1 hypothetical protein UCCLB95_2140 [Levilactobacillus brevis]
MTQRAYPLHEQLLFGCGLTMTAGALDAYSYLAHGAVFAGLQTGNLILLGTHLGQLQLSAIGRYLTAMVAFMVGTMLVRGLQHVFENRAVNQPALVLWLELGLLVIVAGTTRVLPDMVITALLSLAAATELQEFRQIKGAPFTPLMMTGNFRTVAEALYDGIRYRDRAARQKAKDTLMLMGSFVVGAALVGLLYLSLGTYSVAVPIVIVGGLIGWLHEQTRQRKWKH